jgi:hypothetical protein
MNSKLWIRKALSMCLCVAVLATYSMVALASPGKAAGELAVSGKIVNGEAPFVFVNGEVARSGRSVFSGSTITTSDSTAVLNLSKLGKIELAPNTALNLTFDEKGIFGELTSGTVSVLGAAQNVNIKMLNGKTVQLAAGQSVSASGLKDDKDDDDDDGGAAWWIWGGVLAGAAAIILWTALNDQDINVGSNGTVISPTR